MKKLMFLIAMVMVLTSGSVVSAQYHPTKVKWYGKCSKDNRKQKNFGAEFLKNVRILPVHQQRQGSIANWHKVQKQAKAKRQRTLARYRSSAIRS